MRSVLIAMVFFSLLCIAGFVATLAGAAGGPPLRQGPTPMNIDVSQRHTNESEEAVAVNPTNPQIS